MFFLFLESASNNLDLVKPQFNSASIERITPGENQSSSATTEKFFSTSLKESGNPCNVSSTSSTAPDIGENNTTITSVTCKKEMQVGRPTPASNSISSEFICWNLYYYCLSKSLMTNIRYSFSPGSSSSIKSNPPKHGGTSHNQ